jgi:hypothetical protein
MLASTPSQHLESDYRPRRNPKCESTSKNHALASIRAQTAGGYTPNAGAPCGGAASRSVWFPWKYLVVPSLCRLGIYSDDVARRNCPGTIGAAGKLGRGGLETG